MPFRVSFMKTVYWDFWTVVDVIIDAAFFVDIVVNFLSTYLNSLGHHVTNPRKIFTKYLTSWFLFDLVACFPLDLIEYYAVGDTEEKPVKYNSLMRLLRLPRLYKILRIIRLMKAFKIGKDNSFLERLQDFLSLNSRIIKLTTFTFSMFFVVHIIACFWHFVARLDNYDPETWVARKDLRDETVDRLYLISIYWAYTTITTVGYGDISARTDIEMMMGILTMVIGVFFYSYTIGSLASFLGSLDTIDTLTA